MNTALIIIAIAVYILPTVIGWKHKNSAAIMALNLFFGWTVIGWVIAFIWSLTSGK